MIKEREIDGRRIKEKGKMSGGKKTTGEEMEYGMCWREGERGERCDGGRFHFLC